MLKVRVALSCVAALLLGVAGAHAEGTIKIGIIAPYSGQFADTGVQMDNGIKLFMQQHGDKVAGKQIEIIRKDVGGIAPDVAKRLAQELIVRDKVDLLTGFILTPNAMAAGDVSAQAKKFMVVMNAATSVIIDKSPYMVRTSRCRTSSRRPRIRSWRRASGISGTASWRAPSRSCRRASARSSAAAICASAA